MSAKREFNLLTKTTFIYLIFAFIAFASSAVYLTHETNEFIDRDVEIQFRKFEYKAKRYLRSNGVPNRMRHFIQAEQMNTPFDSASYPQYSDTLMVNPFSDETERYRRKTVVFPVNGIHYKAVFTEPIEDYLRLRDDIYGSLIPAFILLAIGIVVFNVLQSGYIFKPFNSILNTMRTYRIGQSPVPDKIHTTTAEFNRMQELFHQMLHRIEDDYQHLKEYTENMAHEIQTPLAVIRSRIENLIDDEPVMQSHGHDIKILWDEANHLSKLGKTLNLLTRIENHEFDAVESINTAPVVRDLIERTREIAGTSSPQVTTDLSGKHRLDMDPYLLDILIQNLLWNAIRYASDDGPIHVETTGDRLVISNYGPPLDFPEERLFERFYKSNGEQDSLGLGLALAHKICELNGLEIGYDYLDGKHTFTVIGT